MVDLEIQKLYVRVGVFGFMKAETSFVRYSGGV
mgnify:CR=1 FL=1